MEPECIGFSCMGGVIFEQNLPDKRISQNVFG